MAEEVKKKDQKKPENDYPIWPGNAEAENGVVYKMEGSGNLIQRGDQKIG